jgi:hypothetical protein
MRLAARDIFFESDMHFVRDIPFGSGEAHIISLGAAEYHCERKRAISHCEAIYHCKRRIYGR